MIKLQKKENRIFAVVIAVIMAVSMISFITGCGHSGENSAVEKTGTVLDETEDSITIVDQAGREVTVKKNPESIAFCYRVVARFLINLGQGDKIKGMGKTEDFLEEVQPSLAEASDVGQGVADIEALAELNPDLFIHKAGDTETLDAVAEIGIPSVGIEVETPEDMIVALDLLGKACGAEEKAEELKTYYRNAISYAEELTSGVEKKKTAIVMGSSIGKVADPSMLQGEMLERAGAENLADIEATELWPTAGTEMIFKWNPDYIFISGSESAVYTAEDIYNDKAWSELKAVKNRHVYTIPSKKDSWEFPGVVSILGIEYMIHTMYPELLSEDELNADVSEFYEMAYGRSYSMDELGE